MKFHWDIDYDPTYWVKLSRAKNAYNVPTKTVTRWLRVQKAFAKQQEEIKAVIYPRRKTPRDTDPRT